MHKQKHPFTSYPAAKHQNTANLMLQTYKKNQWTFLWYRMSIDFSSHDNFANFRFFCKHFRSFKIYNSLRNQGFIVLTGTET